MKVGVYPAGVTPFDDRGRVDLAAMARLLAWFRAGGCAGVVVAGTNGEGPSLSAVEKRELVKSSVAISDGMPIVLGIATSSLEEAVWCCRQAYEAGAAAGLVMAPGYFREASDDGVARWFEALFDRSALPILVYNFPQRTGITLSAETIARLARHDRMIGLKDSSGYRENLAAYAEAAPEKAKFVGDETLLIEALRHGWSGAISGAANVVPEWLSRIVEEWGNDPDSAETKHTLLLPTLRALRASAQPGTSKEILTRLGVLPSAALRLPLLPPSGPQVDEAWDKVRRVR